MTKSIRNACDIAARYPLHVRCTDEDDVYLGSIPGLIGDCCHADSPEQVLAQLKDIAEDLVTHPMAQGSDLPQPEVASASPAGSQKRHGIDTKRELTSFFVIPFPGNITA